MSTEEDKIVHIIKLSDLPDFNVGQKFEIMWVNRLLGLIGIKWL